MIPYHNLSEIDKTKIWHPFTQMREWEGEEIAIISEGDGFYLKDVRGKSYIDGVSSLWCNVHGHRKKEIDEAIKDQLDKIAHSTFLGLSNVPAILLADQLIKIAPSGLTRVFYSDSGSESVEIALKMTYQYWQQKGRKEKNKFAKLSNAYHGDTIGSVSVGGIELFHELYKPLLFETFEIPTPYVYRWAREDSARASLDMPRVAQRRSRSAGGPSGQPPPDQPASATDIPAGADIFQVPEDNSWGQFVKKESLKILEEVLSAHEGEIAALIMEPLMQGAAGMITHPQGYLAEVRRLTQKYDVLLILDEVATGFGRTGKMFACEHEDVVPDIMTVAKGLTGGYLPLAATLTTEEIYEAFLGDYSEYKTFFHGHTFTGNPLACRAALANLEIFEKEQTLEAMRPKIEWLAKRLESFWRLEHVGDIRQAGFMVGIELVKNRETREPFPLPLKMGVKVCQRAKEHGIWIRPLGNVVVLMPAPAMDQATLVKLLDGAEEAIAFATRRVEEESFL